MWCGPEELVAACLGEGADSEDGIESVDDPVHAGAVRALFDDGVAGGLDVAGADVVTVGLQAVKLHDLRQTYEDLRQVESRACSKSWLRRGVGLTRHG